MRKLLKKLRGVLGLGLTWGAVWALIMGAVGLIIGIVDPESMDEGDTPLWMMSIVGVHGFVGGLVFGILLSLAEARKTVLQLSSWRAAFWGALAAAALPLLSGMPTDMVWIMSPIAAAIASVSVTLATRSHRNQADRRKRLTWQPLLDVLAAEDDTEELGASGGLLKPVEDIAGLTDKLVRPAANFLREPTNLLHPCSTKERLESDSVSATPSASDEEHVADRLTIGSM